MQTNNLTTTIAELRLLHEAATKGLNWQEHAQFKESCKLHLPAILDHLEALTAERDQLRAEVDEMRQQRDYWQESAVEMRRYKEAAEAHAADLRRALADAGDVIHACVCEIEEIRGKKCHQACIDISTALDRTPDQSLAAIEARVLREVWKKVCATAVVVEEKESRTYSWSDAAVIINDEATRREEAAMNKEKV